MNRPVTHEIVWQKGRTSLGPEIGAGNRLFAYISAHHIAIIVPTGPAPRFLRSPHPGLNPKSFAQAHNASFQKPSGIGIRIRNPTPTIHRTQTARRFLRCLSRVYWTLRFRKFLVCKFATGWRPRHRLVRYVADWISISYCRLVRSFLPCKILVSAANTSSQSLLACSFSGITMHGTDPSGRMGQSSVSRNRNNRTIE